MRNFFLPAFFFVLLSLSFVVDVNAQDNKSNVNSHVDIEIDDDGNVSKLVITEMETDKSYKLNIKFNDEKSADVRRYLDGLLGNPDREVGGVRLVWNHLPDGAEIEGLNIILRDGHFSIKAKDGCCPGDMEELKDIGEDIKSILG